MQRKLMKLAEAAQALDVSKSTAYELVGQGLIPSAGGSIRRLGGWRQ